VHLAFTGLSLGALGFVWSNWTLAARAGMRVPLWVQYAWLLLLLTLAAVLVLRLLRARRVQGQPHGRRWRPSSSRASCPSR